MIPSHARPLESAQRSRRPLLLSVVAGASTAGVAAYYLGSAWTDLQNCGKTAPGAGCAAHPIWGFSPQLFVAACLAGLTLGALLVVVGVLAHWGRLGHRSAGLTLIALGILGTIAYAGFGLGAAAAVLAGLLWAFPRRPIPGSPAEWSGSLPVGVPPAPRPSGRALPDRPSVTEWQGAVAASRTGPPGASRARANLPTADRLADALRRSRLSAAQTGSDAYPSPVIMLPPPPLGLRAMAREARVPVESAAGPSPAHPGASPETAPAAGRTGVAAEVRSRPVTREPAETVSPAPPLPTRMGAGGTPTSSSRTAQDLSGVTLPSAGARASEPRAPGTSVAPPRGRSPPREYPAATPEARTATTAGRPVSSEGGPVRTTTVLSIDLSSGAGAGAAATDQPVETSAAFSVRSPPAPPSPPSLSSRGGPPSTQGGFLPERVLPPELEAALRPPQPSMAAPKPRVRAWRCPKCRLVNAPWTPRCTRCKTEAPTVA